MLAALLLNLADYYPPEPEPQPDAEQAFGGASGSRRVSGRTFYAGAGQTLEQRIEEARRQMAEIDRKKREKAAIKARSNFRVIKGGRDAPGFDMVALGIGSAIAPELSAQAAIEAALALDEDDTLAVLTILALLD